jgi:hypothetical protein
MDRPAYRCLNNRTVSGQVPDVSLMDALREHNASLKTENERLATLLDAERERADRATTGFEALLRTESERADRAIAAFESLAERLEAIAAAKRPSWPRWPRLFG